MGGGKLEPSTIPDFMKLEEDCPTSVCRNQQFGAVHITGDWPDDSLPMKANDAGYSLIVSDCFRDEKKKEHFRNIMRGSVMEKYGWKERGGRSDWGKSFKPCGPGWNRVNYIKEQADIFLKDCCNTYTKNSPEQKQFCDICTCVENKTTLSNCESSSIIKSCLSYFSEEEEQRYGIYNIFKNKMTGIFNENDENDPSYIMYRDIVNGLLLVLNAPDCNEKYIKENLPMILNSNLIKYVDLFLELLNDPEIQKSEMKQNDLVRLLSSDLIKNLVKAQDPTKNSFNNKFNTFCNNDNIFDGTDWDKKVELYGKICSCFWDPNKNNGNPSNLQKNKINLLKSKEGLPDELKEYAQFASDIEPSGPTYCWDSQCVNNDNNLIPNRDDCPSTNIASCLAYINFDNKGLIKGNITNLAACAATIDNEKQKETLEKLIEKYKEEFGNDGSSGTNNGSGTKSKNKKKKTTTRIIVGVVVFIVFIIVIGLIAAFS